MNLLDLCCGVGGASVGYARAGFNVIGLDNELQPDYPFQFVLGDALNPPAELIEWADFIHASWPCGAYTSMVKGTNGGRGDHPRLYEPGLEMLRATGKPFVIENPAARPDIILCGEMFGLGVLRHRRFEIEGAVVTKPVHKVHRGRVRSWRHGVRYDGPYVAVYGMGASGVRPASKGPGGGKANLEEAQVAMGIDWTESLQRITQAIPPAYTEWLGTRLLEHLTGRDDGVESVT